MFLIAQLPEPLPELRPPASISGDQITISGQTVEATWLWQGRGSDQPERLWLPLDLLEARLGFRRLSDQAGEALEWYGQRNLLADLPTRTLGDEVGLEVAAWLQSVGVVSRRQGSSLELTLSAPRLQQLRRGKGSSADRLVLDLDGPVFVQQLNNDLVLDLKSDAGQRRQLRRFGLIAEQEPQGLVLRGQATRLSRLTLATPWRVVLDGVRTPLRAETTAPRPAALPLQDPSLAAFIQRGLVLDRRTITVGVKPLQVLRAGGDLNSLGLRLMPLTRAGGQQELRYLPQLAAPSGAVIAVNGGFFNRINQLPLGALRHNGSWLSGPILNRGVIAWGKSDNPMFGRLMLNQELQVNGSRRWGLGFLNSGYVKRGLSRYTAAWGASYRALSGQEQALLIQNGTVKEQYSRAQLNRGVPLPNDGDLVVARGRAPLPAVPGDRVRVIERSNRLGDQPNVMGGGPLLMQDGRIVLNGRSEGFSPGFLALAAPRTVVGQGPAGTWLLAVNGAAGSNPTLLETALAMQQLGLRDALNLDGGSSTTFMAAGRTVMNGSGRPPRIHNGLGLVAGARQPLPLW